MTKGNTPTAAPASTPRHASADKEPIATINKRAPQRPEPVLIPYQDCVRLFWEPRALAGQSGRRWLVTQCPVDGCSHLIRVVTITNEPSADAVRCTRCKQVVCKACETVCCNPDYGDGDMYDVINDFAAELTCGEDGPGTPLVVLAKPNAWSGKMQTHT